MMETFTEFSMVGVYRKKGELKFVQVKSENIIGGKFTVFIFMDDKLSALEIAEWKDFSNHIKISGRPHQNVLVGSNITFKI